MARDSGRPAMTAQLSSATRVADVVERVNDARARRTPLRIAAGGTWMNAGRPCGATERLDVSALAGIVDYVPGDLTLTARAGTTLDEIERVTRAEGQWLTLDPLGGPRSTLGATIASASAGPLASAYGTPRDHVLGCEFVSGTGDVVRAGGRVVKNVAGFDLVRLLTGSWGTLGVISEVSVRLRARPTVDQSMIIGSDGRSPEIFASVVSSWMRQSHLAPLAAELVSPGLARRFGHAGDAMLVRWGGNGAFARAALDDAASLGDTSVVEVDVWSELARAEPGDAFVFRVSALPSQLPALWTRTSSFAEGASGFAHAMVSRGVVRCVVPASSSVTVDELRTQLVALGSSFTIVGERLPASAWPVVSRSRTSDPLRASVKRAFDPDGILNPGLLGLT
jgi:glycolate oxidase FAD binding subunit